MPERDGKGRRNMSLPVLARYVHRHFFVSVVTITLAITALVSVFDLMAQLGALAENEDNLARTAGVYAALRFPLLAAMIIPFGVLLATMVTMARLAAGQEIIAISAAGMTVYRLGKILLTGALVIATLHFVLINSWATVSAQRLVLWKKQDFQGPPPPASAADLPGWYADGDKIIHVGGGSADGKRLYDLIVIERNNEGLMLRYNTAEMAVYKEGEWLFYGNDSDGFQRFGSTDMPPFPPLDLKPADFARLGGAPEFMGLVNLIRHLSAPGEARLHALELQRRFSWPLSSLVMVLLAAPLGFRLMRQDNVYYTTVAIIVAGFIYFITERLLITLAANGYLPVFAGVWSPIVIFGLIAWWILLTKQE